MSMPDGSGLDVLRLARTRGFTGGVIAITAVRDIETVRHVVALGASGYLVKPFAFADFADRLRQFERFRAQAFAAAGPATQHEIDAVLDALHATGAAPLPKGITRDALDDVSADLRAHRTVTAAEASERLGISRVGARRYLEHLADAGIAQRSSRRGGQGRPFVEYRWAHRG